MRRVLDENELNATDFAAHRITRSKVNNLNMILFNDFYYYLTLHLTTAYYFILVAVLFLAHNFFSPDARGKNTTTTSFTGATDGWADRPRIQKKKQ